MVTPFFATLTFDKMNKNDIYYGDYLQLNKILNSQQPISFLPENEKAHDEMLFIIIHQAYELWFKQILFEIDSSISAFQQPSLNDNTEILQTVVHRLNRVVTILKVLVHQIDIMETMTPMDFLDFRDLLRPASGFQSWQFKELEAKLGLKYDQRFGKEYYISQLQQTEIDLIKNAESSNSFLSLINTWLERMPFFDNENHWLDFKSEKSNNELHPFWNTYRQCYSESLSKVEMNNLMAFDKVFVEQNREYQLSAKANRAALFIMLYRGYPIFQLPFQLINCLLEIDEQLGTWRYRHMNMVHRTIGTRIGTGGSSGKEYLKGALDKHYIFKELAQLSSFLIERKKLPQLPPSLIEHLSFNVGK